MIQFKFLNDIEPYANDMSELFELCYGKKFNLDYWNWRFLKNPEIDNACAHPVGAFENGRLIAHYGISPIAIQTQNQILRLGLINMLMTHPAYKGQGIFKSMGEFADEALAKNGFSGSVAFVNHNSHYGFIKNLGWRNGRLMTTFSLNNVSEAKNNLLSHFDSKSFENWISVFGSPGLVRGERYLNWRFLTNPVFKYSFSLQEKTLIIYKKSQWGTDILEILKNPNDTSLTLDQIASHMLSLGSEKAFNLFCHFDSQLHLSLEKYGFQERQFNSYFIYKFYDPHMNHRKDVSSWNLSMCDSDIF